MGNMLTSEDPYGNTFTYGYNPAGRVVSVTGSYTDSDDPANLLSATKYNAAGQPVSDGLGDGETETFTYDNRLRLNAMSSVLGSTAIYNYSLTFAPNGNVLTANDSVNGNWSYSYDQFNRLICASLSANTACAMPPTGTPTFTYAYDRFGNRWQQNSPAGSIYTSSLTFTGNATNNNNRMDLYSYDSAGNLLNDGHHAYFYDAENRLIQVDGTLPYCTSNGASGSAATACYYYDAEGRRAFRTGYTADTCDSSGKRGYVFDLAGHVIVETNSQDTGCVGQVYLGDRHFGRQGGGSFFYHSDWLGTVRLINSDQNPTYGSEVCTSLPFGDGLSCNSNYANVWHFTGKERDYESGLDNFGARYNASNFGRFMSPDPHNPIIIRQGMSAGGLPEEAADSFLNGFLEEPQNWNKYPYALNNPLRFIDPTGAAPQDGHHLIPERETLDMVGRAFADAIKTGPLSGNGVPNQPGFNYQHIAYNKAVEQMLDQAVQEQGPTEEWSIQQWKDFATSVLNSAEPAIKEFLDELEENNPGAKAAIATSISAFRVTNAFLARVITSSLFNTLKRFSRTLILCVNCNEDVTWRFLVPKKCKGCPDPKT